MPKHPGRTALYRLYDKAGRLRQEPHPPYCEGGGSAVPARQVGLIPCPRRRTPSAVRRFGMPGSWARLRALPAVETVMGAHPPVPAGICGDERRRWPADTRVRMFVDNLVVERQHMHHAGAGLLGKPLPAHRPPSGVCARGNRRDRSGLHTLTDLLPCLVGRARSGCTIHRHRCRPGTAPRGPFWVVRRVAGSVGGRGMSRTGGRWGRSVPSTRARRCSPVRVVRAGRGPRSGGRLR